MAYPRLSMGHILLNLRLRRTSKFKSEAAKRSGPLTQINLKTFHRLEPKS